MIFLGGLGRGRGRQHLPRTLVKSMRSQLATLVRGSSVTAHCLAATALLTREYQGDHRRQDLISAAAHATDPLTSPSISDFWIVGHGSISANQVHNSVRRVLQLKVRSGFIRCAPS